MFLPCVSLRTDKSFLRARTITETRSSKFDVWRQKLRMKPNKTTGPNAGRPRQLLIRVTAAASVPVTSLTHFPPASHFHNPFEPALDLGFGLRLLNARFLDGAIGRGARKRPRRRTKSPVCGRAYLTAAAH